MLFSRWHPLFYLIFACHCLIYNDTWQSCYAAFESTLLVFQCCAILHPFPHINLSWALFLLLCSHVPRLWLICLWSRVIKSCQSSPTPAYNSCHLIIFKRLHWSPSLDYSIPCCISYALHIRSSFKCVLSTGVKYGNVFYPMCGGGFLISCNHFINFPWGQLVRNPLSPSVCLNSPLWLSCVSWQMEELDQALHVLYANEWK